MTSTLEPRNIRSVEEAKAIVQQRGLSHVKVGLTDIDGVIRGKYMSWEKFFSALDKGFGFCDVVVGWDSNDQLYENVGVTYTGWQTGYPDAPVRVLPETCRDVYGENGMLMFLAEFDQQAQSVCPRGLLRRVLDKANKMGLYPLAAFEYEFFLFNETPHSVREKGYQNLTPFTPGMFGYSLLRNSVDAELYEELLGMCQRMGFSLEGLHTETGPGVWEAAIAVDTALNAADKAVLFKTFVKVWAQRNQLMATFMAKCSNQYPGQSGHVHVSLRDSSNRACFFEPAANDCMSETQRQFVAGQQRYMPELTAMIAQTVNAYSRMVPGFWAPTHANWGVENRTTALRVIPGNENSQRVEYRVGSADANPYIVLAAALASGLQGIQEGLTLDEPVSGNAYQQTFSQDRALPQSLEEAARRLKESSMAADWFGEEFVNHYAATRTWEAQEFRKHVTDWEMQRYFEII